MKTIIAILLLFPWLLVGATLHALLLRYWRPYRSRFEYRALRAQRKALTDLYGGLPPQVFIALRNSVSARIRRRGDERTKYGWLHLEILSDAYEIQMNRPDNV